MVQNSIGANRLTAYAVTGRDVLLVFRKGTTEQTITLAKRDHPGPSRRWRVAFGVAIGKDEFDETHLTLRGVAVEGRNDWEHGGRSIYFRDPDEHLLELATPGLWSNVLGARPPPSNS